MVTTPVKLNPQPFYVSTIEISGGVLVMMVTNPAAKPLPISIAPSVSLVLRTTIVLDISPLRKGVSEMWEGRGV